MDEQFDCRRHRLPRSDRGILTGVVFILLGIIFVLQQVAGLSFNNWWAIFILIPAISSFIAAYRLYRARGDFNSAVLSTFFSGLIVLVVAFMFFFNLDWSVYWPLFIILPGLSLLVNSFSQSFFHAGRFARGLLRPWMGWVGASMILLGSGFLSKNLGLYDPALIHPRWWAGCILLVSAGGLVTAFTLFQGEGKNWLALGNLLAALIIAVPGVVAILGLDWNLIGPIILICAGLVLLVSFFFNRQENP